jgi:uncharacterized protein YeaC (DUF1315 family)
MRLGDRIRCQKNEKSVIFAKTTHIKPHLLLQRNPQRISTRTVIPPPAKKNIKHYIEQGYVYGGNKIGEEDTHNSSSNNDPVVVVPVVVWWSKNETDENEVVEYDDGDICFKKSKLLLRHCTY